MREDIQKLLDSDLSSNKIATISKVEQSTIHRLRKGDRKVKNISVEVAEKLLKHYEELVPMKKVAVLTQEQVNELAKKCEGMEDVKVYKDVRGNDRIQFRNENFFVETRITADSTTVKAYTQINTSEFGTELTNVTTVEELYNTVRNYEKYFLTGGEVTRTMLWIKQMFI